MRKNVHYFKVNYLIWLLTVVVVCMLANPRSLLVVFGACAAPPLGLCVFRLTRGLLYLANARVWLAR